MAFRHFQLSDLQGLGPLHNLNHLLLRLGGVQHDVIVVGLQHDVIVVHKSVYLLHTHM